MHFCLTAGTSPLWRYLQQSDTMMHDSSNQGSEGGSSQVNEGQFMNFSFTNHAVLAKANREKLQKLRQEVREWYWVNRCPVPLFHELPMHTRKL